MRTGTICAGLACLPLLAACGGGEREFEADELVEELNANGTALELGEPLVSEGEALEIYAVRLGEGQAEVPPEEEGGEEEHGHGGGGSLRIAADPDAAFAEYERCERAVSLICFRAANAVLILDDSTDPADVALVTEAVRALGSD